MLVACVPNLGRFTREAPSCGDYMPTAKTTLLPATTASTSKKGLHFIARLDDTLSGQTAMQLVRNGRADDVLDYIDAVDIGVHT